VGGSGQWLGWASVGRRRFLTHPRRSGKIAAMAVIARVPADRLQPPTAASGPLTADGA
jgi:hypothetical protein